MKICDDQGYNEIRVVIATKWHQRLIYLQPYFSALGTVPPKIVHKTFSFDSHLNVREV